MDGMLLQPPLTTNINTNTNSVAIALISSVANEQITQKKKKKFKRFEYDSLNDIKNVHAYREHAVLTVKVSNPIDANEKNLPLTAFCSNCNQMDYNFQFVLIFIVCVMLFTLIHHAHSIHRRDQCYFIEIAIDNSKHK